MNCVFCKTTRLALKQSYAATETGRTQRAECPDCHRVYTLVTVIACEADAYGKGAKGIATKIEKDGLEVVKDLLDDLDDA